MRARRNTVERDCRLQLLLTEETAWLSAAVPIIACGNRLSDDAVGHHIGTELGQAHQCICRAERQSVDTRR